MFRTKTILSTLILGISASIFVPTQAQAGPLLDWILGRRARRTTQPWYAQPAGVPNAGAISASSNGCLQPGVCQVNCYKNCQRTVVNYVPQTCYRTQWNRIPVTQYRPVTNSDPNTGCSVTCMRPCTTYTWQMQRVPYTTYRPVYRTQTYRVPVTYYTNDCGNANPSCSTCTSCNTNPNVSGPAFSNQPTPATPQNGVNTSQNYYAQPGYYNVGAGNAADTTPMINPTENQRPSMQQSTPPDTSGLMDVPDLKSSPIDFQNPTNANPIEIPDGNLDIEQPALIGADKQANSLLHQKWEYSPVRLASHAEPVEVRKTPREFNGQLKVVEKAPQANAIWRAK